MVLKMLRVRVRVRGEVKVEMFLFSVLLRDLKENIAQVYAGKGLL